MKTQLTFINESNAPARFDVVLFQQNTSRAESKVVAWKVIRRCGYGNEHPFTYSWQAEVRVVDAYGNHLPGLRAEPGEAFEVRKLHNGYQLQRSGRSPSIRDFRVRNSLDQGAINVLVYRDGRPSAMESGIAPGQEAAFQIKPYLYIATANMIDEGSLIEIAELDGNVKQLSLVGVESADILMLGGGPGPLSRPFSFHMDKVVLM